MSARGLTYRYIIALTLVALLSAALLGLSWSATRLSVSDGGVINQSGRQRVLSQRIVIAGYEYVGANDEAQRDEAETLLRDTLQTFINSHNELVLAADMSDRTLNVYQHPDTNLDLEVVDFVHRTILFLQSEGDPEALATLSDKADSILPLLDLAANAFTIESEARARRLERIELTAFLITLLVLCLEAAFIFRPAARSINRSMKRLQRARRSAEAANAAKSVFLAQMSHEIRTPLNGVLGMASALENTRLDDDQKTMVDTISASGDLLLAVVDDVLDLSKIEAGQITLEEIDLTLKEVVSWTESAFRPAAEAKGLSFSVTLAPEASGWYRGDPTRIRQILSNLVSNAIKFTETGSVEVHIAHAKREDDANIEIRVRDTGIGIKPERLQSIFEPFEQADNSTTRTHGGSGLGLAISRRLTELMAGTLCAQSVPGEGSQFTARLSLPEGQAPRQAISKVQPGHTGRPLRALIVDDVATNRLVLETLLRPLEVEPVSVASGADALEAVHASHFDFILMDIQMPVMDGVETTRRIRQLEHETAQNAVPITAVTANVLPEQIETYREAGLDRHLAKPVNRDVLAGLIQELRELTPAVAP